MEKYRILEELGQGAFGKVYKAERKEDGSVHALKCLTVDSLEKSEVVIREIHALQQAVGKHQNILQFIGLIAEGVGLHTPVLNVWLIVEYCDGGTLDSFILKDKPSRATVLQLLCQAAEGVAYLHGRNVVHGALKPDNILVDNSGQRPVVKVADFGVVCARALGEWGDNYAQTMIMYLSPELLLNIVAQRDLLTTTTEADVFALGLIIAAILGQMTDSAAPSTDPADPGTDPATDPAAPGKLVPAVYVEGKLTAVAKVMITHPEFPVADMLMTSEPQGSPVKALVVSMLGVYPHQRPTSEQVLGRLRQITGSSGG
ncbi:PREDICTED: serine/threonine-protein kinase 35-like [Branchiostoma belcheri]|uniref:Serine/threonine-protein kinase 35-like n=1 Tax=Branchiostoma belcheri TaxID=7741 RepID=A0A6P5A933_BRABE|nr:PREDICTED: serine/threonine-protein kinase 35-like [Branchiostoma belcheri]